MIPIFWLTGLSGAGKTTIAEQVHTQLENSGQRCIVLDGDRLRAGLNRDLSFSPGDRMENIRRSAEVAKLFHEEGYVVIVSFISPTRAIRALARDLIGEQNFREVYINTPIEVCESRDVKGLYAKARRGEIPQFTGISAPFEAPETPHADIRTHGKSPAESAAELLQYILSQFSSK